MKLRRFCLLCVLCISVVNAFALDREAFTFTTYDLDVRVEPEQQRLGVRGKVTLRNDSHTAQKIVVLQISSSLDWRSINAAGKPLQFVSQTYTSDIDHTGALSEAIVTLPQPIPPQGVIDLDIAYEGVIVLDATRLTRIGAPEAQANSTDWDQIGARFTAVRGVGYVAWYPIATEAENVTGETAPFDILGRLKARESSSTMHLQIAVPTDDEADKPELVVNATSCAVAHEVEHQFVADCTYHSLESAVPTFLVADYDVVDRPAITVHFLRGHDLPAATYADAAEKVSSLIAEWFGTPRGKAQTADLADASAVSFESGPLLLMPLTRADPRLAGLAAAHQLTHAAFSAPRPWINEGLAHFAQALYLQHESGRQAALDYMQSHQAASRWAGNESQATVLPSDGDTSRSLVNTADEQLYRSKAMYVWWMLRDMLGDEALKKAIAAYRPEQDKEPSYLPHLLQLQTQKDLEWFFDDWVYRDRGLPDFKVASAFTRELLPEGYMATITVGNSGAAGAEVPVTVKFSGGEVTKRLIVRGKSNGVIRIPVPKPPDEIDVNDGSVPESDMSNNVFKVEVGDAAK